MAYVGNQPAKGQFRKLSDISGSFDGVTTTFTTSVPPGTSAYYVTAGSASQLLVSLGGVIQQPDTDYTVSTNSITFTTAPAAGLDFFGVLMGDALNAGTPSDGSVTTAKLAGSLSVGLAAGSDSTPSLFFTGDANNGIYSPGTDQLAVTTNGVERVEFGTSEVVFNDGGENYDFRIEGDTDSALFFVDASADKVGIGNNAPGAILDVSPDANRNLQVQGKGGTTYGLELKNGSANSGGEFHITAAGSGGVVLNRGTTEMGRFDSSSRFLVGTSSGTGNNLLQVKGSTLGAGYPGGAFFNIGLNVASVDSNFELGRIDFGNQEGYLGASIVAAADLDWNASDYPSRLVFSTTPDGSSSPTERMRIANKGTTTVFTGTTVATIQLATADGAGTTNELLQGYHSATSATALGTNVFRIYTNGDVVNTNNSYGQLSDVKLKENIIDANSQWSDLKAVRVRNFNFKEGQTHRQIGVIAQELEQVSPGLVSESPDRDSDGNDLGTVTKSVNYSVLYMKAVKALQEAMERIEILEQRLADAGIA